MPDTYYGVSLTNSAIALRENDIRKLESTIKALQGEIANAGTHMAIDGATRAAYDRQIKRMAEDLRRKARAGKITWKQATGEAATVRNVVMESMCGSSTPIGRAVAESLKSQGKTLNEIIARKTIQIFGKSADFNTLSAAQKNQVYAAVVESAGKSNPRITARMRNISRAGRGLIVLSVAFSVYTVATAEDKTRAAAREGAVTAAGIGGGIAGGAAAGLVCGPGAPVCVTVGAFVDGALAAFGADMLF